MARAVGCGLAALLAWAAVQKFQRRGELAAAIRTWRLFPSSWAWPLSGVLPWAELIVAQSVLLSAAAGRSEGPARILITLLFFSFLSAQLVILARTRGASCGCRGGESTLAYATLARTAALTCVAALVTVPW